MKHARYGSAPPTEKKRPTRGSLSFQKYALSNGLRIVASHTPHALSVCISIFMGAGSRYESPEEAGLSHFVEHLCFKGTETRPTPSDVSSAIEGIGGMLNGGTDKEVTVYCCKMTLPHFSVGLDVLIDMLLNSRFDPVEMERERQVIIEEIKGNLDSPQERADMMLDEILWPGHPLGRDVGGSKETVSAIQREHILRFARQYYVPSNTVVSIAGGISSEKALKEVEGYLAGWGRGEPPQHLPAPNAQSAPQFRFLPKDTQQAYLSLGVRGLPSLHPDRFILDLLNVILGEGMSSRLFVEIREKRGLAYDIHSYSSHFRDTGVLGVVAGVDPEQVELALTAILEVISSLKDIIPEREVARARELAKGRLVLRLEDTYAQASWAGAQELLAGKVFALEEVTSIIDSITREDLQRVANGLLASGNLNLAVVGPIKNEERLASLLRL